MTPGLSVIIDAIKESRKIFQRMNSYAMYRIAETLRVLIFMTLAILVFNFYPVTAVMIVMLAVLNDGAILSIAYDNVHYKNAPEAWNMRMVLGISTVLGIIGVVAAFGLFCLGERVFHLDHAHIQTLMYLKLSVAGHLTIFLTRTRGHFWSIRPARILLLAVIGTQTLATLIAVYGVFMTPLGWGWAAFVWGYALSWFIVNDFVKLLAYRIFDPVKAVIKPQTTMEKKPMTNAKAKPHAKADPKTDAKAVPDAKADPKADAKAAPEAKTDPKADVKAAPEAKADPNDQPAPVAKTADASQPEAKGQSKNAANTNIEPKPDAKAKPQPEADAALKPETKTEPEAKTETSDNLTPQLVKRVHQLYEELGRDEVQAVNDMEQAAQKSKVSQ